MGDSTQDEQKRQQALKFMQTTFGLDIPPPEQDADYKAHTTLTRQNQPEFYADAPWRLEPDQDAIPLLFIIREANLRGGGRGPWRLDELRVDRRVDGAWQPLCSFGPGSLPGVDGSGFIATGFWWFGTRLNLHDLPEVDPHVRGQIVSLRVVFDGRFPPYDRPEPRPPRRYLQVHLAAHPLPLGRAASGSGPRSWFYGDPHYHSAHTNDVWEFGNPVAGARTAAHAIGLDWLVITDHSCDLDEPDLDRPGLTRWEGLKLDVDDAAREGGVRVLRGEEVTVQNRRGGYLHMLAIGLLEKMIPGGFWSDADGAVKEVAEFVNGVLHQQGGYPADAVQRLFGRVLVLDELSAWLPAGTLTFAAHPYDAAQPPLVNGTWNAADLAHEWLTGHEFWNGRVRRQISLLDAPTDNPFEQSGWTKTKKLARNDRARLEKLHGRVVKKWDKALMQSVDRWSEGHDGPGRWPVFIAGSDAHGDFNYSVGVGWDYRQHLHMCDNGLGRARTAVFVPGHSGGSLPDDTAILAALKRGACAVTDGPMLELSASHGGRVARMGDVLALQEPGPASMDIVTHTTPEFGAVDEVEVVVYLKGGPAGQPVTLMVRSGEEQVVLLDGRRGYCRLQAWTTGPDGERFCCYTNPVWLRIEDRRARELRVRVRRGTPG